MATDDISRHLFRPEHHYTGVRMQQSRPLLDSDVNEGEMLDDEVQRAIAVEVIGPHGSTDDGFKIGPVNVVAYDFDISPGSYWLGGLRHEIEALQGGALTVTYQRLRNQADWLQWNRADNSNQLPKPPTKGSPPRSDLVYLTGWEQSVSAVEDPELLELGLGGPDTSARIRRMCRVYVKHSAQGDCNQSFAAMMEEIGAGHHFDKTNHLVVSGARLTVVSADPPAGSVCKPTLPGGYTGAEVQTIRVFCIEPDCFLWGYDDTSPLYRIDPPSASGTVTITFQTQPRDTAHFPATGQVIEILPWGAALPNGERVADHFISPHVGGGVFARVKTPYDPAKRTVEATVLDVTKLSAMNAWLNQQPAGQRYFYARVWNPGDDGQTATQTNLDGTVVNGTNIGLRFQPGVPVALVGTGLALVFNQMAIPGDYWILAARPSDPDHLVPWDLHTGAPPHGPRRFYCPLAMIDWSTDLSDTTVPGGVLGATVHSCRRTFRPLTRQGGCCSVSVGDGNTSFGDYTSINAALADIPDGMPAKICVLPGTYRERILLENRRDIVIEGCGLRTSIVTPTLNNTSEGLISITSCANIRIANLGIEAKGQFGVMIFQAYSEVYAPSQDVTLEDLSIQTSLDPVPPSLPVDETWILPTSSPIGLSTVAAYLTEGLTIRRCKLSQNGGTSSAANITVRACSRVVIEDSRVASDSFVWGGIHIGEACTDVRIEHNTIEDGLGHGITLGTLNATGEPDTYIKAFDPGGRFLITTTPALSITAGLPPEALPPGGGDPEDAVPTTLGAPIRGLQILENTITSMAGSGISVLGFYSLAPELGDEYEMIEVHDVEIADNHIHNNFYSYVVTSDPVFADVVAFGGVILAASDAVRIHDNRIHDNGQRSPQPLCGVYIQHGETIAIESNQILDNGTGAESILAGARAGIALQMVGRRVTSDIDGSPVASDRLLPAARVRGNVVSHPVGRALQIYGIGPMFVSNNIFVSQGLGYKPPSEEPIGHCVEIQNIGHSSDLLLAEYATAYVSFVPAPRLLYTPGIERDEALLDGRILFTDNQVRFKPAALVEHSIWSATRLQSYGDIGVFDNQFLTEFVGLSMFMDTMVTAWSTRTTNNRWEVPGDGGGAAPYQTDMSAITLAAMNITALNQGTRCIVAQIAAGSPALTGPNPIDKNQTYHDCTGVDLEGIELLLQPPS